MGILEIRHDLTPEERKDRAEELLEEFNVSHLRNSLGNHYQRVNAAVLKLRGHWHANPKFIFIR